MQKAEQIIKSKTMSDISDFINLHFKPEDNMFGYIPISTKEKSNKSKYINGKMKKKKKGLYGVQMIYLISKDLIYIKVWIIISLLILLILPQNEIWSIYSPFIIL